MLVVLLAGAALSQYPTILEDFNTRNMLLDDLMELSEFTKQRIIDMNPNETGGGGGLVLQVDLPSSVQGYSSQDMQDMLCNVSAVIDKLTNKKSQQLLLMLGSQRYWYLWVCVCVCEREGRELHGHIVQTQ